jgi:tRNA(fMet)-specific endonuclease VapC
MGYMLDTNILSDFVDNPIRGKVVQRLAELREEGEKDISISIIVATELRFGAANRGSAELTRRVEHAPCAVDVLPLEAPADADLCRNQGAPSARRTAAWQ